MKTYPNIAVQVPEIYLPRPDVELHRWAVIACDQFTSQPEYWHKVEQTVGEAPSTLKMIFPEVYLEQPGADERIQRIQLTMQDYLSSELLTPYSGMVYVERQIGDKLRRGILLALDLEQYDYNKGSSSHIRATEGTIIERLPPRIRIREGAKLELPHILVLIDDPERTVIDPVAKAKALAVATPTSRAPISPGLVVTATVSMRAALTPAVTSASSMTGLISSR